jgi:hypothetical protein
MPEKPREVKDDGPAGGGIFELFGKFVDFGIGLIPLLLFLFLFTIPPEGGGMTPDAMKIKVKDDCKLLCIAIEKYNILEGSIVKSEDMTELENKYIANLKTMKDTWGNKYVHDPAARRVYSKGPDKNHDSKDPASKYNADDIFATYNSGETVEVKTGRE